MRAELIYTCEECGAEFARKNRPAAPILCKRCRYRAWKAQRRGRDQEKQKPGSELAQVAVEAGAWCCLPKSNITLEETYQLGSWNKADGWIIDEWLDWEDANVTHWMPLPDPPREREEEHT